MSNIQAQRDLNLAYFSGTWYSRFRVRGTGAWDSGKVYLRQTSDHDADAYYAFAV